VEKENKDKKIKGYTHFDCRSSYEQNYEYVSNSKNISTHGFYPLIHFVDVHRKYDSNSEKKFKEKKRLLYYSSHIDRSIYIHYSKMLNAKYNSKADELGISNSVIAYRTNMKGKSSYHFALNAFSKMREFGRCNVMIGDFTSFFDNLDHRFLKSKIKELMNYEKLPDDWYNVFKSLTDFSYVELGSLIYNECTKRLLNGKTARFEQSENGYAKCLMHRDDISFDKNKERQNTHLCVNPRCCKYFNEFERVKLSEYKNLNLVKKSGEKSDGTRIKPEKGIPQGTAISATLANIYMIDFDKKMNSLVEIHSGTYMRYSDDFIVILPEECNFKSVYEELKKIIASVKLEVKDEKTQIFKVDIDANEKVKCVMSDYIEGVCPNKSKIEYLGLAYTGNSVIIKEATKNKFLRRANRKLKSIENQRKFCGGEQNVGSINFRRGYTQFGAIPRKYKNASGNYLTYENRANKEIYEKFDELGKPENIEARMDKMMKRLFNTKQREKSPSLKNAFMIFEFDDT